MSRTKIYISHANPEDNSFTRWLALKLMSLGYEVWCDLIQLELGVDFWKTFEKEIRQNTKRFLFVASKAVREKENALRELSVADATRRAMKADDPDKEKFIIALRKDQSVSWSDIDPIIIRNNGAEFSTSWAAGLAQVVDQFEKDEIERKVGGGYESTKRWWDSVYSSTRSIRQTNEIYASNWFRITELPTSLFVYKIVAENSIPLDATSEYFPPLRIHKNTLITFASEADIESFLEQFKGKVIDQQVKLPVNEIIAGTYDSRFLHGREAKNVLLDLLNKSFDFFLLQAGTNKYEMANKRRCFWFPVSDTDLPHVGKGQLIGVQKLKQWHFALSGSAKLFPYPAIVLRSHIIFSSDGKEVIPSDSIQHSARRRQGRNWWNAHWRDKLASYILILLKGSEEMLIDLGGDSVMKVEGKSSQFGSSLTYINPDDLEEVYGGSEQEDADEDIEEELE